MIWTCANPDCGKRFDYLEGKFFRFRQSPGANEPANAHSVRHFWLCGKCCEEYSLQAWRCCRESREAAIRLVQRPHLSPEAMGV
jgi:hypothetical protein